MGMTHESDSLPRSQSQRVVVVWDVAEELGDRVDRSLLEKALREALANRKPDGPVEIGLTVTTDEGIRELNEHYRGVDAATDVLSFPMLDYERPEHPVSAFPSPPGEPVSLGDLVVSYPRALAQAQEYGHSPEREMAFLIVHGVMHLLGYDHEDPEDRSAMRREEEEVLGRLGLTRGE